MSTHTLIICNLSKACNFPYLFKFASKIVMCLWTVEFELQMNEWIFLRILKALVMKVFTLI